MLDKLTSGMTPGADAEEQPPQPLAEFEGYAECSLFAEEVKITLYPDEMLVAALFDQLPIPYGRISAFAFENYRLTLHTSDGPVVFTRMGQEAEWLYDKLTMAYNGAVLRALLVEGESQFEATGRFTLEERNGRKEEQGVIRLYPDCLCLLPPNENARRIPLCFVTGMEKGDFSRTLRLSTGESYTLSHMGRELENLDRLITANIRALREQTLAFHKTLAPDLSPMQAAAAGKLMPLGAAAPMASILSTAPPLEKALKQKIRESRLAGTYPLLERLSGGNGITIGAKPTPEKETEEELPEAEAAEETTPEEPAEPAPILWVVAAVKEQGIAAVELALADDEAAATYLYRIEGDGAAFTLQLHRGLEAAGFQRELILLPEEKLALPEHMAASMLIKRTPALQLMRESFAGRAIHSSEERWKRDIMKCGIAKEPRQPHQTARFCGSCGAKLTPGARFCGQCGAILK